MNDMIMVTAPDMAELNLLRAYAPLRRELERAMVVSSALVPADVATMNSRVRYTDEKDGASRTVSLVYPIEADVAKGKVSVLAPVGTALLGLSEGQSIEWHFPDGSRRRLKLEKVLFQPERLACTPLPRAP
ncbi:MAG TPA: nucleoside diphosphate kinase regulator [Burkholderiales bacterium]|nr:nucleoside diphosphate kinase regulator [Burkholderiales bacterium]